MKARYIFRLDGAKENDFFFDSSRSREGVAAYAGTSFTVGPGWIPDLIEVEVHDDHGCFTLTLIELEALEITARASCRKYLPEPSSHIVIRFVAYLETVINQCQATADPRGGDFRELRSALADQVKVTVRTAGALRSSAEVVESHTLLDQPERLSVGLTSKSSESRKFPFGSTRSFSREEIDGLRRTVRIFHAVVTGSDHSACTVHSYRNLRRKPLDDAIGTARDNYPHIDALLANKSVAGMRVNCEALVSELILLWRETEAQRLAAEEVANAISRFVPIATSFPRNESMRVVFDSARATLFEVSKSNGDEIP